MVRIARELTALSHPRVLFVRLDNIGDVILLSPAIRTVKEALPGCSLTLWTTSAGAQAVPLLPDIDDLVVSRPIWQELGCTPFVPEDDRRLVLQLRRRAFDAAFIFTSFSQTPHPAAAVCALAGIHRRAGSSYERAGGRLLSEAAPPPFEMHQADRNLRLLEDEGFPVTDRSLRLAIAPRAAGALPWAVDPTIEPAVDPGAEPTIPHSGYVVAAPWASCSARSYPALRMLEAARLIGASRGWPVCLVGRESERPQADELLRSRTSGATRALGRDARGRVVDLVGRLTVPQLASLIAGARLVFCNNTLPMHLADAVRTPSVVTYAGTDLESHWRPRHSPHRLLRRDTICAPCFLLTCPARHQCLDIPLEEVAAEAESLLAEVAAAAAPRVPVPA